MQRAETNDGQPTVARRCADGQADRRHEPADPGMTEPDRPANEKPSQRL